MIFKQQQAAAKTAQNNNLNFQQDFAFDKLPISLSLENASFIQHYLIGIEHGDF